MIRASGQISSPELLRHLVAVHAGKADIEEHHLGAVAAGRFDGVDAGMRRSAPSWPESVQEPGHPLRRVHVVVDDEHPKASSATSTARGFGRNAFRRRSLRGGEPHDEFAPLCRVRRSWR